MSVVLWSLVGQSMESVVLSLAVVSYLAAEKSRGCGGVVGGVRVGTVCDVGGRVG